MYPLYITGMKVKVNILSYVPKRKLNSWRIEKNDDCVKDLGLDTVISRDQGDMPS